jgi:hypothetical protein
MGMNQQETMNAKSFLKSLYLVCCSINVKIARQYFVEFYQIEQLSSCEDVSFVVSSCFGGGTK